LADTPFDDLLAWLDPDRDAAGLKYETIRAGLIRIFIAKGFSDAEDLADETITRVTRRLPDIIDSYVDEPARYFVGVARNIVRERYRPKELTIEVNPVSEIQITNQSDEYECLMRCLQFLARERREMILDYHVYEGHDKIETHKTMAEELEISKGALRLRAHHLRTELEKCVQQCMESLKKQTKSVAGSILDSDAVPRSVSHGPGRRD
jgi:DNA-directed RNA polymerase specialized sigma24 family protein